MADTPIPAPGPSRLATAASAGGSTFVGLAVFKVLRRLIDVKFPGFLDIDATEGVETICITAVAGFGTFILPILFKGVPVNE